MRVLAQDLGFAVIRFIDHLGKISVFAGQILMSVFTPPIRLRPFVDEVYKLGVLSLIIICVSGTAVGMVLSLQGYNTLVRFGATQSLGAVVGLSLIRELGPVLTALLTTGRAGSATAAEIATMVTTEQLDGLRMMAVDPVHLVVTPKTLAMIFVMPLLSALFIVFGLFGGYMVGVGLMGVDARRLHQQPGERGGVRRRRRRQPDQSPRLRRAGRADLHLPRLHQRANLGRRQRRHHLDGRHRLGQHSDCRLLHHRVVGSVTKMSRSPTRDFLVGTFVLAGMAAIAYLSITVGGSPSPARAA